jgi:iron complex outermembrane receptor protein
MKKSIRLRARAFVPALSVLSLAVAASVQAQTSELNPVVVTAAKYEEDSQRVPAFINVITRQQIEQSGATTVNEAIMKLAGVPGSPSLYGGNEYSLDLMGFGDTSAGNMVVVVDGVPFREGDGSEVRLSSVQIDAVERIEVQRGGAGVLYGEGATAGLINIVTRASAKNSPTRHIGTVSASFGSKSTREYRAYANYVNETLDLSFSGLDGSSDGYRINSNSEQKNGTLSLKYSLAEKTRVGFSVHRDDAYALTPGALTLQQYSENPKAAQPISLANKTFMDAKTERYAVFIETQLYGFQVRFDAVQRTRKYDALGVLYGTPTPLKFDSDNHFNSLSARRSIQFESFSNTTIAGVESNSWEQDRLYPTQPNWGLVKLASNTTASYVKNDLDIKSTDTRITVGVRSESLERNQLFTGVTTKMDENVKAWEFGVTQKINFQNSVFIRRSQSYRLPNLDELPTPTYDVLGNPIALRTQFDKTNELGWKFNNTNTSAVLRLYQSELTDEIIYDPVQSGNMNIPNTRRSGLDSFTRLRINPQVSMTGAYSHRKTEFGTGPNRGKQLPMAPQNVFTLRGDWRFVSNQTVGLGWMHVASQQIAGDFANEKRMPSYNVADARYVYQMTSSDISLVVRNLANKNYYSYATITNGYSVYPDQSRSLMLTLRHKF